jgi:hypothetical protein
MRVHDHKLKNICMETGHVKNVAAFEQLIGYCTAHGVKYNPAQGNLKVTALSTLLANAQQVLQGVKVSKTVYDNSTNAREVAITEMRKLATRMVSALAATGASTLTIEDSKSILRKIQGRKLKDRVAIASVEGEPKGNTRSTSQQDVDSMIDNFAKLIQSLSAEALYVPNEEELKLTSLNTYLTSIRNHNKAVTAANLSINNARIARNRLLYADAVGVHQTASRVKQYVKSVFGSSSEQFKQVSRLRFIKFK